jgi:hypothetical protein
VRTLKENLLWIRPFGTVEELLEALRRTPGQVRLGMMSSAPAVA